ncbi:MAG: outer membrane beta-barrel protein [Pseudomonadota bacterium]|nr:outer membrane beta-barrel protein [Pseudomonadota bacterium]
MDRRIIAGIAVASFAAAPAAMAIEGPYVSAKGIVSFADDSDWTFLSGFGPVPVDGTVESDYDTGYGVALAIGRGTASGFRVEGEVIYQTSDIDDGRLGAVELDTLNGDVSQWGFMGNAYYDFNTGGSVMPYIGAGIGGVQLSADVNLGDIDIIDDDATVFAYQLTAGLGFELSPNVMLTAAYRYQATEDTEFTDEAGGDVEFDWASHNLDIGLLFTF